MGAKGIRSIALVLALAVAAPFAAAQEAPGLDAAGAVAGPATFDPAGLRRAAVAEVLAGRNGRALAYTDALVARDPGDVSAHLIRTRAARNLGLYDRAAVSARAAWRGARTAEDRYTAALAQAQVLASRGARTRAQFWLRRAVELAPTEAQRTQAVRDFRYVRARNPWSTALNFSVSPSSNVNGGSSSETSKFYGLPYDFQLAPANRALSGVEYAMGFDSAYRLAESARSRTRLRFGAFHRTYSLSQEARDAAPGVDGGDFTYSTASLGLAHDWLAESRRLGGGVAATLRRDWYGGDPLSQSLTLDASLRYVFTPRLVGQAALSREWQAGDGMGADARRWRGVAGAVGVLPGGHRLGASLTLGESRSDADYLDYSDRGVAVSLTPAVKPLGLALEFGLSATRRHHDRAGVAPGGREELRSAARATAVLERFDYYGFVPAVTLTAERVDSDIGLYDSEGLGIGIGIRSQF